MTFRGQVGRKGTSKQFSKSAHEKKAKEKKKRLDSKYFEETPQFSPKQITEKTLSALNRLGNQVFALSPFSQYFDDWIVNLRQVVTEFETNPVSILARQTACNALAQAVNNLSTRSSADSYNQ